MADDRKYWNLTYAECPTVEVEVDIAAPAEQVWRLVSDINLPARFSTEFTGATWLDGVTGPAQGARFLGRSHHEALGEWSTVCTVVDCKAPEVFGYTVEGLDGPGEPSASWRFTLAPVQEGTRLAQWFRMGPARSGLSFAIEAMPDKESRIVSRRLKEFERNMRATVEGVKRLAEEGAA
jgi:uncharacterized protein YndB with AHSA1/START domain